MHKHKLIVTISIVILLCFITSTGVLAESYGWGYKKNTNQKRPDIGQYQEIIEKYDAYYADESGEKVIYLTFDNGYEQGHTENILNVLQQEKVPATFFVTGHYVEEEPELIKRMVDDGHIIGNHSYHHPDFTKTSQEEIKEELATLEQAVAEVSDQKELQYLRPPRGTFNEDTLAWTNDLGYIHVFWSLAFKDWVTDEQKGWQYAYDQIMDQIHPGAIVLLHTVSSDNAEALERVISDLKDQGYTFKSLDDLHFKNSIPNAIYGL